MVTGRTESVDGTAFVAGVVGAGLALVASIVARALRRRNERRRRATLLRVYASDLENYQLWIAWPPLSREQRVGRSPSQRWLRVTGTHKGALTLDQAGPQPPEFCRSFIYAHVDGRVVDKDEVPAMDAPPGVLLPRPFRDRLVANGSG